MTPLRFFVDMNWSPGWVPTLTAAGWPSVHWSTIGPENAEDADIMAWFRTHGYAALTEDLDFGRLLALTRAGAPSEVNFA